MAWKSAGNGNSFGNKQLYDIFFYSISADGTTATLIANYQGYGGGIENDWFQWHGLSVPLAPNAVYGYTFGRAADGPTPSTGWEHVGTQGNNPYPGGQLITSSNANTNNGPVTYGTSGNSDATFDLGLIVSQKPICGHTHLHAQYKSHLRQHAGYIAVGGRGHAPADLSMADRQRHGRRLGAGRRGHQPQSAGEYRGGHFRLRRHCQ